MSEYFVDNILNKVDFICLDKVKLVSRIAM